MNSKRKPSDTAGLHLQQGGSYAPGSAEQFEASAVSRGMPLDHEGWT